MAGLNTSLSVATQSLLAQEASLEVANNNIANASTPGYARETVVLTEAAPLEEGGVTLGGGATLQGFSSVRDQLLNLRIQQQTSAQSSADAQSAALEQVQTLFPSSGESLSTNLSSFFTSVSALSAQPTSTPARQSVLASAQNLVSQFHSVSGGLTSEQSSLNSKVSKDVAQINQISSQIAGLNTQLAQLNGQGQNAGPIEDQIAQLESNLSQLTNISVSTTGQGDTITTGNGTALVLGGESYALGTTTSSSGLTQVLDSNGENITTEISDGDLSGSITARDTAIPGLLSQLDTLASDFGTAVNAAQAQGYDQNGSVGGALFTLPSGVAGAAAQIQVATSDPSAIAASSDGSTGSNGNVANLSAVETSKLIGGSSVVDASANLVYQVGTLVSNASAQSNAIGLSLTQLNQQQSSTSGVSIDEESANLVRYQQAYEAAARVISTIATLFTATLNMGGS